MTAVRARTAGVRQVVAFNWPKLAAGAGAAAAAGALGLGVGGRGSPGAGGPPLLAAAGGAYLLVASLAASWWVYDRSGLHDWAWLRPLLPARPGRWALLHAGFDEAGPGLHAALGRAAEVVDLSPGFRSGSASLRRARRRRPAASTAVARPGRLPLPSASCDWVLLVFTAHEVRGRRDRERLFTEARRALRPGGRLVLVEHLRDLANLAAFGPGALHFQPRREWERLADRSGFVTVAEARMTPLVRGWALCPC